MKTFIAILLCFQTVASFSKTDKDPVSLRWLKAGIATILNVTMNQTNPSEEPKEFKLHTHPKGDPLGVNKRGIVRRNSTETTTFMIFRIREGNFVLCAIRGKRRYIASLDAKTHGIELQCKKKKACEKEIREMYDPYIFALN